MIPISRLSYLCIAGRGTNTHAYTHSVAESHHVFLNLHTLKFYCLPDNYEIVGMYKGFTVKQYRCSIHFDLEYK